ncbi:MAG TPA: hypothetical protein VJR47_17955 [Stellaceae bacterium]|nr:hypothetical protein [Stellaceae bacterium]
MDELRVALAAATGAVIGGMVIVAVAWTLRSVAQRAAPAGTAEFGEAEARPATLHWSAKLAILLLSIGAYGYLGYANRPPAATASAPQDPVPADFTAPTAQFAIGGVQFSLAPPQGYCLYPPALLSTVVAQQARINPDNVVHAVFASCDELRDAKQTRERIRDFGMVMTPRSQIDQNVGPAELERIVAGIADPAAAKRTLDQRLRDAQSRLRLQTFSSLGMLGRDANAAYFGYLFRASDGAGGFDQVCVMALATEKDRLVSYYLYSDYSRDARDTLNLLVQRVKSGLGDLAARNG